MTDFYTYVGTDIPGYHVDRLVLDDGREISLGVPVQLSEDEVEGFRASHFVFEPTSAEDAEAVESAISDWQAEQPSVGDDIVGTAPLLGGSNYQEEPVETDWFQEDHPKEVN